ncbi:MAG: hypothetical protein GTN98_09915 [Woeseiaceae bacterium]|nr:hypothetical protein [Woeseiaceae bacterium]
MNELDTWTAFFGWMTIVNLGIYVISVFALWVMRDFVYRMNARMFGISEDEVARTSFKYVGAYKLLITVFCFAPWLALKLMA